MADPSVDAKLRGDLTTVIKPGCKLQRFILRNQEKHQAAKEPAR